jgi:esterase/lipase superfamily enzyme
MTMEGARGAFVRGSVFAICVSFLAILFSSPDEWNLRFPVVDALTILLAYVFVREYGSPVSIFGAWVAYSVSVVPIWLPYLGGMGVYRIVNEIYWNPLQMRNPPLSVAIVLTCAIASGVVIRIESSLNRKKITDPRRRYSIAMTRKEALRLLLRCNGAQLDAIIATLELPAAYLPGSNLPTATRATAIMELVDQRNLLADLESALREMFPNEVPKGKAILVLSANPVETDRLQIDEEVRVIKQMLQEDAPGREYRVESEWAVRAPDLSKFLLQHQPTIVHFSGHGSPTGEIVLESQKGEPVAVPVAVLAELFDILKTPTECVVLNACYSQEQAGALAQRVRCVVGMDRAIGDSSALSFAGGFYRGLAFGKDYQTSFRLGCNAIDLTSLPDAAVPHFTTRDQDQIAEPQVGPGGRDLEVKRTWGGKAAVHAAPDDPDSPRLYPVWFGTDRCPVDSTDPSKGFSADRDTSVHFGTCQVAIPKSHKFGSVGSSWWKRFKTWSDDRLTMKNLSILQEAEFWKSARQTLAEWDVGERMAFVFIHGFNVSFSEAAIRSAQMAFDLKVPGIAAFFSWPSKGKFGVLNYTADEASIEASEAHISDFLTNFAEKTDAGRIDVVAHSMGNRGLLRAMQRIVHRASTISKKPFRHIVFTAPDVDSSVFRDLAGVHKQLADNTTLYLSSKDRALASSGLVHDAPRAGFVPPVTLVDGIDVIEVANADLTLLGHGYYGAAEGVLYDMRELLVYGTEPSKRARLSEAHEPSHSGKYWRIGA